MAPLSVQNSGAGKRTWWVFWKVSWTAWRRAVLAETPPASIIDFAGYCSVAF